MATLPARAPALEIFRGPKVAEAGLRGPSAFFWRLRAANGEIVADGAEAYSKRSNAVRAAERAKELMATAVVEVIA